MTRNEIDDLMRDNGIVVVGEAVYALCQLVAAAERETISEEWWMCVQSDLENGVKSLNEAATEKWQKEYPEISKFAAWLEARGNQ